LHLRLNLRLRGRCTRGRTTAALHALQLPFELLVAVLQLLDRAGELADLRFEAIDPHRHFTGPLRDGVLRPRLLLPLGRLLRLLLLRLLWCRPRRRREAVAIAEEVVEEALRRRCARSHSHKGGDRRHGGQPKRAAKHWTRSTVICGR
jgi:hypothetical protein